MMMMTTIPLLNWQSSPQNTKFRRAFLDSIVIDLEHRFFVFCLRA